MSASQIVKDDSFEMVREFVRKELCEINQLEKDAFQMTERVIVQKGQPCGFFFCVYGPRNVRLTAVWDLKNGSIFFYDPLGNRIALHAAPRTPTV